MASPINGLANLYSKQGKYEEAELLYRYALRIREKQLGQDHPETAETMHDFARFWEAKSEGQEACIWYDRAEVLGAHHPKTIETRKHFIALLYLLGKHREAAHLLGSKEHEKG